MKNTHNIDVSQNSQNISCTSSLHKIESLLVHILHTQQKLASNIQSLQQSISLLQSQQFREKNANYTNSNIPPEIIENCNKMGKHIDFVENVYNTVKSPLSYLTNKINYMIGSTDKTQLPDLEVEEPQSSVSTITDISFSNTNTTYQNIYPDISSIPLNSSSFNCDISSPFIIDNNDEDNNRVGLSSSPSQSHNFLFEQNKKSDF